MAAAAQGPTSAVARSLWAGLGRLLRPRPGHADHSLPLAGAPRLVADAAGGTRCTACYLCTAACPARCIEVSASREGAVWPRETGARRRAAAFTIDMARCVFCGYCVEACPERALALSTGRRGPAGTPLSHLRRPRQRLDREALLRDD